MSVKSNRIDQCDCYCNRRDKCQWCCFTLFAVPSVVVMLIGLAQIGQPIRCIGTMDAWSIHRSARRGAEMMTLSAVSDYSGAHFVCILEGGSKLACGQNVSEPQILFTRQEGGGSNGYPWEVTIGNMTGSMDRVENRLYAIRMPGYWINSSKVYLDAPASTSSLYYENGTLAEYIIGSTFVGEFRVCIERTASLMFSMMAVVLPVSYSL